jgi:hypothetical protein
MTQGRLTQQTFVALVVAVSFAGVTLIAQPGAKGKTYVAPLAADGHPDISGVWEHNAATPLERPAELSGRATLTDDEVKQMEAIANKLFGDGSGDYAGGDMFYLAALKNLLGQAKGFSREQGTADYNQFWSASRWFENRTSLITEPADGKMPAMTADAKARLAEQAAYRRVHPSDGPEDIGLSNRCITGWLPMLGAAYNSYYEIVQAPSTVAVNMEMRHDSRMIPVGRRQHLPSTLKFWLGDPIGHWEGDTFVVDTTNFRDGAGRGIASDRLHLIEKFSRVADDWLKYEVTVDDPGIYAKPWTAVLSMRKSKDQIYEYACHEGNLAMYGILNGARMQEKKTLEKAAKTTDRQ